MTRTISLLAFTVLLLACGDRQADETNSHSASVITHDDYRGIRTYYWAPNSEFIYYIQDEGGNENFHVYSANISNGDVIDLTPVAEGVRAQIEAVSADHPDYLIVGMNERDSQVFDLYLVNGRTGERELIQELGRDPTPDLLTLSLDPERVAERITSIGWNPASRSSSSSRM